MNLPTNTRQRLLTHTISRLGRLSSRLDATDALVGKGLWACIALVFVTGLVLNNGAVSNANRPILHAEFDAQIFPVAAAQRLHQAGLPQGRGFNPYEWGGYLDEALPEYHVFIDSRSDVYSQAFLRDYITVITVSPGWQGVLDRYDIAWALLPQSSALAQLLALTPSWRCQPEDTQGVAVLCERAINATLREPHTAVRSILVYSLKDSDRS